MLRRLIISATVALLSRSKVAEGLLQQAHPTASSVTGPDTYRNAHKRRDGGFFTSSITGPSMPGVTYVWSQYIFPTTVGTEVVVVSGDTTTTTTEFHEGFELSGTIGLPTRTDTNIEGTVTGVKEDFYGSPVTLAYPTEYFDLASVMTWKAIIPTMIGNASCCTATTTHSETPAHTPFAASTGPIDSKDPYGHLYTLIGPAADPWFELHDEGIASLWGSQVKLDYTGCAYTMCPTGIWSSVAPASAVGSAAYLLATSTRTVVASAEPKKTLSRIPDQSSGPQGDDGSPYGQLPGSDDTTPPPLTIGSSVITADSSSQYIIDSHTLVPGGSAITVSGTRISLAPGATELIAGSKTAIATSGSTGDSVWSEASETASSSPKDGMAEHPAFSIGAAASAYGGLEVLLRCQSMALGLVIIVLVML